MKTGDYVLATKYSDGDPGDHFCVGYYNGSYDHHGIETRHLVVDGKGKNFRHNGFRRVARVSLRRGNWIVQHLKMIERARFGVWHWYRAPWRELRKVEKNYAKRR